MSFACRGRGCERVAARAFATRPRSLVASLAVGAQPWELDNAGRQLRVRIDAYVKALGRSTTGNGPKIRARREELRRLAAQCGKQNALERLLLELHGPDAGRGQGTAGDGDSEPLRHH